MTAVEITFMCFTVFAPLLVWFVVLLVRNRNLPVSGENNEDVDNSLTDQNNGYSFDNDDPYLEYSGLSVSVYDNDKD